jgi:ADP-ribose pyrophosphatase YjhB (NUDIX family)
MNKKIYFNNQFILLTQDNIQQAENQDIVLNVDENPLLLKKNLETFLQQTAKNNLILVSKNVNETLSVLKNEFTFIEAAGGLIKNNDCYLFIFRLGKWDLPKGKLDAGEEPVRAAVRECEEECGIKELQVLKELPSSYHIYFYKEKMALKITYWYLMQSNYTGILVPQTEENIQKAEWIDKGSINDTVLQNTYPAIADVLKDSIGVS